MWAQISIVSCWGQEVSEVILGQDEPGHLQHMLKELRLDWTSLCLLHTLAPVGSAVANCGGGFTLSLCVLLPPTAPKHISGEKYMSNLFAEVDLLTWGLWLPLHHFTKLREVKCLPKRGDFGRQARRMRE